MLGQHTTRETRYDPVTQVSASWREGLLDHC